MKDQEKKLWDLYCALTNTLHWSIVGFIALLGLWLFYIFVGGYLVGISILLAFLLRNTVLSRKKEKVINPFGFVYGMFGSPTYLYREREFYEKTNEYMKSVWPKSRSWIATLYPYVLVTIFTIIFWRGAISDKLPASDILPATIILSIMGFITGLGGFLLEWALKVSKARDPEKISKFFGMPTEQWKVDLRPVRRPSSITALMMLFYGLGVFGIVFALVSLAGGVFGVRLIFSMGNMESLLILSGGTALIGSFCLGGGYYLQKMMKGGGVIGILLSILVLFFAVPAFIVVPLVGQIPVSPYHAIWMFGGPLAVIYIIKRNWKKFRG